MSDVVPAAACSVDPPRDVGSVVGPPPLLGRPPCVSLRAMFDYRLVSMSTNKNRHQSDAYLSISCEIDLERFTIVFKSQ